MSHAARRMYEQVTQTLSVSERLQLVQRIIQDLACSLPEKAQQPGRLVNLSGVLRSQVPIASDADPIADALAEARRDRTDRLDRFCE